jgi:hypothetical protein
LGCLSFACIWAADLTGGGPTRPWCAEERACLKLLIVEQQRPDSKKKATPLEQLNWQLIAEALKTRWVAWQMQEGNAHLHARVFALAPRTAHACELECWSGERLAGVDYIAGADFCVHDNDRDCSQVRYK